MKKSTETILLVATVCIFGIIGYFIPTIFKHISSEYPTVQPTGPEHGGTNIMNPDGTNENTENTSIPFEEIADEDITDGNDMPEEDTIDTDTTPPPIKQEIFKVKKITAGEIESILNSGEIDRAIAANFKERISSRCLFDFYGRNPEEGVEPASYSDILMRTSLKTWESITILSLRYDEHDRLTYAKMKVHYAEDMEGTAKDELETGNVE